jgi:hypothetical protein
VGPTNESNWVIPGVLLVGAYPASQDDIETFELITSILKLGVRKFVCLQQEYRPGVPEGMWREGLALRPYYEDVQHIVANKSLIPVLREYNIVDYENLSFEHCPIVDCGITDDSKVLDLARKLVQDISMGELIYLHCWGGHGRTGTVVSIMLHIMYGLNPYEAMERCQAVHDLRRCHVEVGSPQTQTQRDQVIRIVDSLIRSYRETPTMSTHKPTSPSMLTRVMSPAANTLRKLFNRSSPSNSTQNSTSNLHQAIETAPAAAAVNQQWNKDHPATPTTPVPTAATQQAPFAQKEVEVEDSAGKEHEIQPAMPTSISNSLGAYHNASSNANQASNGNPNRQKSITFAISPPKDDSILSSDKFPTTSSKTSLSVATDKTEIHIGPEVPMNNSSASSVADNSAFSPMTPAKQSVLVLQTPKPSSFVRQSTEKLKNCLSNSSSPEPNVSELDDYVQKKQQLLNLTPVVKRLSMQKESLLMAVEEGHSQDDVLSPEMVKKVTKEVLNLQTGGSFTVQKSRQSSGSDAFVSPYRDDMVPDRTVSIDKDPSLGIKMIASTDSFDEHHHPILTHLPQIVLSGHHPVSNTGDLSGEANAATAAILLIPDELKHHAPPAFRASTAGAADVSYSLDGITTSDNNNSQLSNGNAFANGMGSPDGGDAGASNSKPLTRAVSATSVGATPVPFSRQASMSRQTSINKKEVLDTSNPVSRRGSINGFMEPISATSVAPSLGPGQFSRQSSLKRNGTLSNTDGIPAVTINSGSPLNVGGGRFSRQSSIKREAFVDSPKTLDEHSSIQESTTATNTTNMGQVSSSSSAGVRSTVASARQELEAIHSNGNNTVTNTTPFAATGGSRPSSSSSSSNHLLVLTPTPTVSSATTAAAASHTISGTAVTPTTSAIGNGNTSAPASSSTLEEKKRPVPPGSPFSSNGRGFGGVAQSVGRKLETAVVLPSSNAGNVTSPSTPTTSTPGVTPTQH